MSGARPRTKYERLDDILLGKNRTTNDALTQQGGDSSDPAAASQSVYIKNLIAAAFACTKAASALPVGNDYSYFATFPEYQEFSTELAGNALQSLSALASRVSHNARREILASPDTPEDVRYQAFVCALDDCQLYINNSLTRMQNPDAGTRAQGVFGPLPTLSDPKTQGKEKKSKGPSGTASRDPSARKPQNFFKTPVDNSRSRWVPRITTKPNAAVPLYRVFAGALADESLPFPHPYQVEINQLAYAESIFKPSEPQLFRPLDETPCNWIETVEELEELEKVLCQQSVIAIDLEHHSHRSYLGIVCLMQISTRDADYLIDTLALRDELHILNSSFTDPKIVKVLHGAKMDILWLQRDLGLYIVNMFDTGEAARALEFQSFGLAYLLTHYCAVTTNKKYQLADWRLRPLPAEMMLYARQDTHYLLYIYDRMRTELIEKSLALLRNPTAPATALYAGYSYVRLVPGNDSVVVPTNAQGMKTFESPDQAFLLAVVFNRSRDITLSTFEKDTITAASGLQFEEKYNLRLPTDQQSRLLLGLLYWRDDVARREDESVHFMLPNFGLIEIVQNPPKTVEMLQRQLRQLPPVIQQNPQQFVNLIHRIMNHKGPVLAFFNSEDYEKGFQFSSAQGNVVVNSSDARKTSSFSSGFVASALAAANANMTSNVTTSHSGGEPAPSHPANETMDYQTFASSPAPTKQSLYETAGWTLNPASSTTQPSLQTPTTLRSASKHAQTPGNRIHIVNQVYQLTNECMTAAQTVRSVSLKLASVPMTPAGNFLFDPEGLASAEYAAQQAQQSGDSYAIPELSIAAPIPLNPELLKSTVQAHHQTPKMGFLSPRAYLTPAANRTHPQTATPAASSKFLAIRAELAASAQEMLRDPSKLKASTNEAGSAIPTVPEGASVAVSTPIKQEDSKSNPVEAVLSWDAETQAFLPSKDGQTPGSNLRTPGSTIGNDLINAASLPSPGQAQTGSSKPGTGSKGMELPRSMREVYSIANRKKKSEAAAEGEQQGVKRKSKTESAAATEQGESKQLEPARKRVQLSDEEVANKLGWRADDSAAAESTGVKQEVGAESEGEAPSPTSAESSTATVENESKLPAFRFSYSESPFVNVSVNSLKKLSSKPVFMPDDFERRTQQHRHAAAAKAQVQRKGAGPGTAGKAQQGHKSGAKSRS